MNAPAMLMGARPDRVRREYREAVDVVLQGRQTTRFTSNSLDLVIVEDRFASNKGKTYRLVNGFGCFNLTTQLSNPIDVRFDVVLSFGGCESMVNQFDNPSGFSRGFTIQAGAGSFPFGFVDTYSNLADRAALVFQITNPGNVPVVVQGGLHGWIVAGDQG